MNTLNKCLIIIIFLFFINQITDNKLVNMLKNGLNSCSKSLNEDEMLYFNRYINNLVVPKQSIIYNRKPNKRILADDNFERLLINHLFKTLSTRGYKFNNIRLINKIYYYDNIIVKDIEPFNFGSSVTYQNKSLGTFVFNIESYVKRDRNTDSLMITSIRYENDNPVQNNNILTFKSEEQFSNNIGNKNNYDDLFIKPTKQYKGDSFFNDTDNSLIPTINEISNTESLYSN